MSSDDEIEDQLAGVWKDNAATVLRSLIVGNY